MKFAEWATSVPTQISDDPIWNLEVYRLAQLASDLAERDSLVLKPNLRMRSVAHQLHSTAATISGLTSSGNMT